MAGPLAWRAGLLRPPRLNLAELAVISCRETFGTVIAMAKTNPILFLQQVRTEVGKVVWPTRREVILTTIMVFIMAALTATFFSLVDLAIRSGLAFILT
jgi:preprotein translocase subunit SecE